MNLSEENVWGFLGHCCCHCYIVGQRRQIRSRLFRFGTIIMRGDAVLPEPEPPPPPPPVTHCPYWTYLLISY